MDKIFVSNVVAYATGSDDAKAAASVGVAVASKLNGNDELVGSFNANRQGDDRKIGFITFRKKFHNKLDDNGVEIEGTGLAEAREFAAKKMANGYKIGSALNPQEWAWGEADEEANLAVAATGSNGATIHIVDYIKHDTPVVAAVETPAATAQA